MSDVIQIHLTPMCNIEIMIKFTAMKSLKPLVPMAIEAFGFPTKNKNVLKS